jgi:hypothetical protein
MTTISNYPCLFTHKGTPINDIQSTVIYPDGTVWEGSLSKEAIVNPIALSWSTELSFSLGNKSLINAFSKNH